MQPPMDWTLIDSAGPPDDVETPQDVVLAESESLESDASLAIDYVQDVKP